MWLICTLFAIFFSGLWVAQALRFTREVRAEILELLDPHTALLPDFHKVTLNQHFWYELTLRNPLELYSDQIRFICRKSCL
jgi:hypothetical protein